MRKLLLITTVFFMLSCSDNTDDFCEIETQKINQYYEDLFANNNFTPNELSRLRADQKMRIKNLGCN